MSQIYETFQIMSWGSYADKLLFIVISIGAQSQQRNVTPESVQSCIIFQGWESNYLACKSIFPTPPYSQRGASIDRLSRSRYIT